MLGGHIGARRGHQRAGNRPQRQEMLVFRSPKRRPRLTAGLKSARRVFCRRQEQAAIFPFDKRWEDRYL